MSEVLKTIKHRIADLMHIKKKLDDSILNAPEGHLRITETTNKKICYYHRKDAKDTSGIYIRDDQVDLARKLAQKDYNRKIRKEVDSELKLLNGFLERYHEFEEDFVFAKLHSERQKLISPILEKDEEFINRWKAIEYRGLAFDKNDPVFLTDNNEQVRSKSEILIANILKKLNIPYKYECPLELMAVWGNTQSTYTFYPDFTLLDVRKRKEVYLEHFGMMDNSEYADSAVVKLSVYEKNNIFVGDNLIFTAETRKHPLNTKDVENKLRKFFNII